MNNKNKKAVFKFWFPWNTEKIEKWLTKQAEDGWILERVTTSMRMFHFKKGDASHITYSIDCQNNLCENHKRTAKDSWKLEYKFDYCYLWSKTYDSNAF